MREATKRAEVERLISSGPFAGKIGKLVATLRTLLDERDALAELARIGGENDEAVRQERDAAVAQAAKMREALRAAVKALDGYAGEGICIEQGTEPDIDAAETLCEIAVLLGIEDGDVALIDAALAAVEPGA